VADAPSSIWTCCDGKHPIVFFPPFGLDALTEGDRVVLVQGWSRLNAWPDTVPAFTRLRPRFFLATLSNGGLNLQQRLIEHIHLPVDRVLSAEQFQHFKPDAEVYLWRCPLAGTRAFLAHAGRRP
jgi:2-haloacid dehalogenase